MKRIVIATDAWQPQVNGVVRTLQNVVNHLKTKGHEVTLITPDDFTTVPTPGYGEIRLSLFPGRRIAKLLQSAKPTHIHIATEGPIGWATRRWCLKTGRPFTSAYHTQFPEYLNAHFKLPIGLGYRVMKRFHDASTTIMAATPSLIEMLSARGFKHMNLWTRGVDLDHFSPTGKKAIALPGPVLLYVGRVSVEKNLTAFLDLDWHGSKLVVGDGPALHKFKAHYPDVHFAGAQHGAQLAAYYRSGDIFVFPSKTDTYGLVLLEALASGLPVIAYPVTGPKDVLAACPAAILTENLQDGVHHMAERLRKTNLGPVIKSFIADYSWQHCADLFDEMLVACD